GGGGRRRVDRARGLRERRGLAAEAPPRGGGMRTPGRVPTSDDILDAVIAGSTHNFGPSALDFGPNYDPVAEARDRAPVVVDPDNPWGAWRGPGAPRGGAAPRREPERPPQQAGGPWSARTPGGRLLPSAAPRGAPPAEGRARAPGRRLESEAAYPEHPAVQARTWSEVERWRASQGVLVEGDGGQVIPKPTLSFDEAPFPDWAGEAFRSWGLAAPSPLQAQAWPLVATGRDVMAVAAPGMGRTLAYALPLLVRALQRPGAAEATGPAALVLVSSQEQGDQFCAALEPMAVASGLKIATLTDEGIPRDVAVLVATVSRLAAALGSRGLASRLDGISALAFDDADALLADGGHSSRDLDRVLGLCDGDVQMLLFAATSTEAMTETFKRQSGKGAVVLSVAPGSGLSACRHVVHRIEVVHELAKQNYLDEAILKISENIRQGDRVVIFVKGAETVQDVSSTICSGDIQVAAVHGRLGPEERRAALEDFRAGSRRVLVADAGGSVDGLPHVQFVINYDCPTPAEYTQHLGSCCAPDERAFVMTLLTPQDFRYARGLALLLEEAGQAVPEKLRSAAAGSEASFAAGAALAEGEEMRPGDWHCVECGAHQYARRRACRDCGAARPKPAPRRSASRPSSLRPRAEWAGKGRGRFAKARGPGWMPVRTRPEPEPEAPPSGDPWGRWSGLEAVRRPRPGGGPRARSASARRAQSGRPRSQRPPAWWRALGERVELSEEERLEVDGFLQRWDLSEESEEIVCALPADLRAILLREFAPRRFPDARLASLAFGLVQSSRRTGRTAVQERARGLPCEPADPWGNWRRGAPPDKG
ncbi:unnamed protein product, partial [Prorocentrum cordatum]